MSKYQVDLNADLGEGAGYDDELIPLLTSANIACGFHAGSPHMMRAAVKHCVEHSVHIGAHPSFPDIWGFGRREMKCTNEEIIDYMLYQIGSLAAFCQAEGVKLYHVKPHGSIYNMAFRDMDVAEAIAEGIRRFDKNLILFAQPNSYLAQAGKEAGLRVVYEVFADRAYDNDGSLTSRKKPNSVLHDPDKVLERTLKMVTEGKVITYENEELELEAGTICLHGDNPAAIMLAQSIRQGLIEKDVEIIAP
jgi:UPF0271 protein